MCQRWHASRAVRRATWDGMSTHQVASEREERTVETSVSSKGPDERLVEGWQARPREVGVYVWPPKTGGGGSFDGQFELRNTNVDDCAPAQFITGTDGRRRQADV